MLELVVITAAGVLAGAVTGSIPGLHPNTVIFSSLPVYLGSRISFLVYICFVSGLSVSHTFHDFLPAIYLNAPSSESAVASIPGAEMARNGEGKTAFNHTVTGGLITALMFLVAAPVIYFLLEPIYAAATSIMPAILLFFLSFIVLTNGGKSSFLVAGLSAALGILAFRIPVNQNFILMPVFSGLFAIPAIIESMKSSYSIPDQESAESSHSLKGGLTGFVSGLIAGTVPGVGAGAATSFLSPLIDKEEEALTGLGAVNTSDIFVSFIALYLLEKSRSGASVAISILGGLDQFTMATALGSSLFAVGLSVPLAFRTQEVFLSFLDLVNLDRVLYLVLGVIFSLTVYFTGVLGLLVLFTSSCIGFLAWSFDCRTCCMSVLIVPALLFYLGVGIFI
ncbi:MAG: tripartite tricarboxylate transporter permease [Candidatus Nanohalobium sp.]